MTQEEKQLLTVDICARLPYGVKSSIYKCRSWFNVSYWNANEVCESNGTCKPILFPISCLSQEITVRGKTFTPLLKLAKIAECESNGEIVGDSYCFGYEHRDCFYWNGNGFKIEFNDPDDYFPIDNQVILIDKLNEWMIDYRGLIPTGLAVSVFDFSDNPYK